MKENSKNLRNEKKQENRNMENIYFYGQVTDKIW